VELILYPKRGRKSRAVAGFATKYYLFYVFKQKCPNLKPEVKRLAVPEPPTTNQECPTTNHRNSCSNELRNFYHPMPL
jgi:hypothetical protein